MPSPMETCRGPRIETRKLFWKQSRKRSRSDFHHKESPAAVGLILNISSTQVRQLIKNSA